MYHFFTNLNLNNLSFKLTKEATRLLFFTISMPIFMLVLKTIEEQRDQFPLINSWLLFFVRFKHSQLLTANIDQINAHISMLTPEHSAAAAYYLEQNGKPFYHVDARHRTAFYMACSRGNEDIIEDMLPKKTEQKPWRYYLTLTFLKIPNQNKQTPLMAMIMFHHVKIAIRVVERLLSCLTSRDTCYVLGFNEQDDSGNTALQHIINIFNAESEANQKLYIELVKLLCGNCADPLLPDHNGKMAVHNAIELGQDEILAAILATVEPDLRQACVVAPRKAGDTSLHLAARYGRIKCFEILLNEFIANAKAKKQDISLKLATQYGRTVYDYIIEYPDQNKRDHFMSILRGSELRSEIDTEIERKKNSLNGQLEELKKDSKYQQWLSESRFFLDRSRSNAATQYHFSG